jgi:hypothetical protein
VNNLKVGNLALRTIVSILLALFCLFGSFAAQEPSRVINGELEAEKAWELLIKAKGGRDRSYSLSNMLTQTGDGVRLDVFPNLQWAFSYLSDRRSISGRRPVATLTDLRKDEQFYANENGTTETKRLPSKTMVMFYRLAYLLETKWDRPKPVRITVLKRDRKGSVVIDPRRERQMTTHFTIPE